MRRTSVVAVTAAVSICVAQGAAAASVAPGTYKATGGVSFSFRIVRGTCASPPASVTNPKAKLGKPKKGLCYLGGTEPVTNTPCADGSKLTGDTATTDPGYVTGLRLSPSGKLHFRRIESSGGEVLGYSELTLTVSGGSARGMVRRTSQSSNENGPVKCDTGTLSFTARRGR